MSIVRRVSIEAKVAWRAAYSPSSRRWIGVCDELNIATEAGSLDELHTLIPESISLLLSDLVEDDEFERYLRDKGWQLAGEAPHGEAGDLEFDLPWHMITEGNCGIERVAH